MTHKLIGGLLTVILFLTACTSLPGSAPSASSSQLLIVTPKQSDPELEIALAKLSELINLPDLSVEQRASFLYDRGVRYDSLGLSTLARIDFSRALQLQPAFADAYNFIGIYMTQARQFDRAYESFDAVLELDPAYDFAYFNRGMALYYGGRTQLAIDDLQYFYDVEPRDAYRSLWLYFAHKRAGDLQAEQKLHTYLDGVDKENWNHQLLPFFLEQISANELIQAARYNVRNEAELAERLCEVYFYLGKKAKFDGEYSQALNYFKLAMATNVYDFVEHRYAIIEMNEILIQQRDKQS